MTRQEVTTTMTVSSQFLSILHCSLNLYLSVYLYQPIGSAVLVFGKSQLLFSIWIVRDISNRFSTMVWIIHFAFNFAIVISAHFLLCSFSYLELFFSTVNYRIVTISNFNKEAKCGKRYCFISTPLACLSSMILTFIAALAQVQNEWKISRWHSWSQIAHRAKNYFQIATALYKHVTDNGKSRATWAFDNRVSLRLFVPVEEVYLTSKLLWHWFPLRLISAIHDAIATFYFRVWVWGWEC